jgi:hypothetical protein
MKVLVLTSEPIDANAVRAALGDEAEGAEVLVVSPALNDSPLAFWVSDSDEAIGQASEVAQETVERLEEGGLDAAGDTGESEPLRALEDAMTTFPADRVVVFAHPEEQRAYREEEIAEAQQRLGVPVIRGEISR